MSVGVSLRDGLVRRLALALAAIGCVGAIAAYVFGGRYVNLVYDRGLSDDVVTLASQIELHNGQAEVNLPPAALSFLLADEGERVLYRVVDLRDGRVVASNGDLGPRREDIERRGRTEFRDALVDKAAFRVGSVVQRVDPDDIDFLVEVGETMTRRRVVVREILAGVVMLFSLMIGVAVIVVRTSIHTALEPLKVLEAEAATRSGSNLTPLQAAFAPTEVHGLIDAINRMMERLSTSIEAQSRFIANAAHQLRTPVAGLRLQAQLGLEEAVSPEARARLAEIDQSAARAAHIIEQLLTLSKAEAGTLALNFRPVDLAKTAGEVVQRYLAAAAARDIDLGYSGVSQAACVLGNEVLLAELVSNLVDNSIRYGRSSGTVTIKVTRDAGNVALQVIDDGPGIAAADIPGIFDRFYQGDSASEGGAGLGLAIVKEIAERHSALVRCEALPNRGLVVTVVFRETADTP